MKAIEIENIYYVGSIVVMTITVIVAIVSLVCSQKALSKELKAANERMIAQLEHSQEMQLKQARELFFAEYTKRYQDIILHMPIDDNDPQMLKYLRLYYDLCSEEYHLYKKGLIDEDVWKLWGEGMQEAMKRQSFRDAWTNHLSQSYSDQFFIDFMQHEVMNVSS